MTRKEFDKMCRDVHDDSVADGFDVEQCAYDLAECLLSNADVLAFVQKEFCTTNRTTLKEIIADNIHG